MKKEDFEKFINSAAKSYASEHSNAPDKETPDWIITDYIAGAWAAHYLLSKEISELKLQLSERNDRLEGVDKRNYELLEYADSLKKEISEKDEELRKAKIYIETLVAADMTH